MFKIGDKVVVINTFTSGGITFPQGLTGDVIEIRKGPVNYPVVVKFDVMAKPASFTSEGLYYIDNSDDSIPNISLYQKNKAMVHSIEYIEDGNSNPIGIIITLENGTKIYQSEAGVPIQLKENFITI